MGNKRVLFVGSFKNTAKDGSVGGQMYACKCLINSHLSEEVEWILLDSTGKSVPPSPFYDRIFSAILRMFKFGYLLLFRHPTSVLVFSGNGPSVYEKGTMIIIAKLLGRKTIFAPRGGALINEIADSRIMRLFFKLIANRSEHIICQGDFWKVYFSALLGKVNDKKLVVIPNWIDYQLYQGSESHQKKTDANEVNILFMGWIQVEKGVHDLFDALMKIELPNHKINMYYLGDGNQRNVLQNRVHQENKSESLNFYFPGWVYGSDKLIYLKSTDIFVLPSYVEGMPNSLMEAMATGIACISTNVGAVPDLINNQVNGIMFTPKDVNALAEALNSLIVNSELRQAFATKAKEKIYQIHSLENAVASFKRIL